MTESAEPLLCRDAEDGPEDCKKLADSGDASGPKVKAVGMMTLARTVPSKVLHKVSEMKHVAISTNTLAA